jgi:hypothetical protein
MEVIWFLFGCFVFVAIVENLFPNEEK